MKICMTVFNAFTHDARVYKEAQTLLAAGHRVLVLALAREGLPEREVVDGIAVRRIPLSTRRWPRSTLTQALKYVEYFTRTLRAALAWNADVYHAHNANTLLIGAAAARLRRAWLVYDAHEFERGRNWGSSNVPLLFRQLWALPERLAIHRAELVITVCDSIAAELVRLYNVEPPAVVRNIPLYHGSVPPAPLRRRMDLDDATPLVIYQGVVTANRGLEPLLEAISRLEGVALAVFGSGPRLAHFRNEVHRRGLADRVCFTGQIPLEELPAYTAAGDVGAALIQNACLSYYYCLPNKLFEYLHAGLPVVASNFPEIASVVRRFDVGALVDPEDPEQIASALRAVLTPPERRAALRAHARRAATHYTWQEEEARLLQAYDRMVHS